MPYDDAGTGWFKQSKMTSKDDLLTDLSEKQKWAAHGDKEPNFYQFEPLESGYSLFPPPENPAPLPVNDPPIPVVEDVIPEEYYDSNQRKTIISQANWGFSLPEREETQYEAGASFVEDFVRDASAKYWTMDRTKPNQTVQFLHADSGADLSMYVPFSIVHKPASDTDILGMNNDPNVFFDWSQQTFNIQPSPGADIFLVQGEQWMNALGEIQDAPLVFSWILWVNYVTTTLNSPLGSMDWTDTYNYMAFPVPLPHTKQHVSDLGMLGKQAYVAVEPEYNFHHRQYENLTSDMSVSSISERWLPNIYSLMLEKENTASNPDFAL